MSIKSKSYKPKEEQGNEASEQTWYRIDFGDVEELCYALDLATVCAYKERLPDAERTPLEERVRIDIEGNQMWVSAKTNRMEMEYRIDLAFSPFGNPEFDAIPRRIRPPKKVAFMTEPRRFIQYLKQMGSAAHIMMKTLWIKWEAEGTIVQIVSWPVTGKRRPL